VAHGVRHGLLERARPRFGVAQQEGDKRAAQVLGREGHARLALEHGLHDLGPAPRVERLCVVDAAAAQHEHVRPVSRGLYAGALNTTPLTLQHL